MRIPKQIPSLQHVVDGIYDAALDPGLWKGVIQDFASYGRSSFAMLVWRDKQRPTGPVALRVETDHSEMVDQYYEQMRYSDPIWKILEGPVDTAYLHNELEPRQTLTGSARYTRYLAPCNVDDRAGVLVLRQSDEYAALVTLGRGHLEDSFARRSLRPLKEISPHVRRALQISHRFRTQAICRDSLFATLDLIEDGVFFPDATHRVVFANAAAERYVKRGVVAISNGRLRMSSTADNVAVESLLQRVVKTGGGHETDPGGTVALHKSDGTLIALLAASPLRMPSRGTGAGRPEVRAAVYIRKNDTSKPMRPVELQAQFGLTAAETRVAHDLTQGCRLKDIAERYGLGKETVRTQLRSLFDKTGVRRQSDLIKVLLTAPAEGKLPN